MCHKPVGVLNEIERNLTREKSNDNGRWYPAHAPSPRGDIDERAFPRFGEIPEQRNSALHTMHARSHEHHPYTRLPSVGWSVSYPPVRREGGDERVGKLPSRRRGPRNDDNVAGRASFRYDGKTSPTASCSRTAPRRFRSLTGTRRAPESNLVSLPVRATRVRCYVAPLTSDDRSRVRLRPSSYFVVVVPTPPPPLILNYFIRISFNIFQFQYLITLLRFMYV
jgi:hypothetical protein